MGKVIDSDPEGSKLSPTWRIAAGKNIGMIDVKADDDDDDEEVDDDDEKEKESKSASTASIKTKTLSDKTKTIKGNLNVSFPFTIDVKGDSAVLQWQSENGDTIGGKINVKIEQNGDDWLISQTRGRAPSFAMPKSLQSNGKVEQKDDCIEMQAKIGV